MRDVFLIYHFRDQPEAVGVADGLRGRGVELGDPVSLWPPGARLLKAVDAGLFECRFALVLVTAEFLTMSWPQAELDGLTRRPRVVSLLHGVEESDVAPHSRRLAVAAIPGDLAERVARLVRADEDPDAGEVNGRRPRR